MATIPKELPKAISWVRRRVQVWAGVATQIGLQPQQVDELSDLAQQANAAWAEFRRLDALAAAQGARYRDLARQMRAKASAQVGQVRGYARSTGTPEAVYSKAQLRPPKRRGRVAAPGTARGFVTSLTDTGGVELAFRCPHPKGVEHVTYRVDRQVGPYGDFEYFTTTKQRRFVDERIPIGAGEVTYRITAMTSTRDGQSSSHTVRLGTIEQARSASPTASAAA